MSTLEAEVESCDAVFFSEFAELLKLVVSPSGMQHLRTPPRHFFPAGASPMRRPSPLSLYPWRESHEMCIRVCAAQEASSSCLLSIPNGRIQPVQLQVRPAARPA